MRPSPDSDSSENEVGQEGEEDVSVRDIRFGNKVEEIVKTHFIAIRQVREEESFFKFLTFLTFLL
jgi:hypothetical protein